MERYNPVAQTRPKPPRVSLFAEERHWGQQFCQMDRDISVRSTKTSGPVKVDHLQKGSQIFQSDRTEMVHSIWFRPEISGILRWIESALCILKWKEKKGVIARAVTPLAWHAIACLQRAKDG